MNSNKLLLAVVVLQSLVLAFLWLGSATPALAQVPDAGAQRMEIVSELRSVNAKLDTLIGLLEGGNLQVQAVMPDDEK